jgi:pimeloyl-ACP methyl ester carboxylesterase
LRLGWHVDTLVAMDATEPNPHVVIIGGFLTESLQYRPMRERLLAVGADRVTVAPIHLPDWGVMGLVGMGPLLLRGARAIREARRQAPDPVIVIGHSLGGLVARLATCEVSLDGRRAAVADDVGALVTLGTPHAFAPRIPWRHAGVRAAEHLARYCPDDRFAPATAYLTVGSRFVRAGRRAPTRTAVQLLNGILRNLVGETPGVAGDGLIGADRCRLDGVRHIELDDTLHGLVYGPWYGDEQAIERWWPAAVEEWRGALAARAGDTAVGVAREAEAGPGPAAA